MPDFDPAQIPPVELPSARLPAEKLEDGASKRAAKRDSLFLLASLSTEAGEARGKVRVRNLSGTGLMADCEANFSDGDRLVVDLRGIGNVSGYVTWVRGDRIGLAFDKQIDPQAARKPVKASGKALPVYLRSVQRVKRFST